MSFTTAQKVDIRRYCGYPVFGGTPTQAFGYRFMTQYGTLEFRMNNLATEEETVVTNMLTTLNGLETAITGAGANLDTDSAAVWTHNKREVKDRAELFDLWRGKLCEFFGVQRGPNFGGSGNSMELVV